LEETILDKVDKWMFRIAVILLIIGATVIIHDKISSGKLKLNPLYATAGKNKK